MCFGGNIKKRERFQKLMMIQNQRRWGGGGEGTPLHNPFTYEVIPNGMVTEPLWSEILFINSL